MWPHSERFVGGRKAAARGGLFGSRQNQMKGGTMFSRKQSKHGPATQKLLDIAEGRRKPDPKQQALLDKQQSEFEANLTEDDKRFFKEFEAKEAFDKKYVLRSDYERDLKLARHDGIVQATTFCVFVLPVILVCLFLLLRAVGWIQPGEFGIN